MTKRRQFKDVTYVNEDGVKVTICDYRGPRKGERTYGADKGKYSIWASGHTGARLGAGGITQTVEELK
jgi:hypothetical protein